MSKQILQKITRPMQNIFYLVQHHRYQKKMMVSCIKVKPNALCARKSRTTSEAQLNLKWHVLDILKNYPELSPHQAQQVLIELMSAKDWLVKESWSLIEEIVYLVLDKNSRYDSAK